MGRLKIYISCPITIPFGTLVDTAKQLSNNGQHLVKYWDRKEVYDPHVLNTADLVLFMLPNNSFSMKVDALPIGLRNELKRADAKGIRVGIIYKTNFGALNAYESILEDDFFTDEVESIKGVAGTAGFHNRLAVDLYPTISLDAPNKKKSPLALAEAQRAVRELALDSYKMSHDFGYRDGTGDRRLLLLA